VRSILSCCGWIRLQLLAHTRQHGLRTACRAVWACGSVLRSILPPPVLKDRSHGCIHARHCLLLLLLLLLLAGQDLLCCCLDRLVAHPAVLLLQQVWWEAYTIKGVA
jgi:hypothetical protein